jgi:sugar O-acyltransferase (sialic acid O-acetyltransferase NeuD family)
MLIYGSTNFAETIGELVRACGYEPAGFVDDFSERDRVLGTFDSVLRSHPPSDHAFALAIGYSDMHARWEAWKRVRGAGYAAPPLVHPRAVVAPSASIGSGSMIMAGAIVDVRASIGDAVVVWPNACINHDVVVGDNCFISPSVTICGLTRVGSHSFMGAGSVVADRCVVPEHSRLKMLSRYTGRNGVTPR